MDIGEWWDDDGFWFGGVVFCGFEGFIEILDEGGSSNVVEVYFLVVGYDWGMGY